MSAFRRYAEVAGRGTAAVFGECVEIRHIVPGEFTRDMSAYSFPPFTVVGILDVPTLIAAAGATLDGAKSELVMQKPVVEFQTRVFSDAHPAPKTGCVIVAITRPGQPCFSVLDAKPDGISALVCQLAPMGSDR